MHWKGHKKAENPGAFWPDILSPEAQDCLLAKSEKDMETQKGLTQAQAQAAELLPEKTSASLLMAEVARRLAMSWRSDALHFGLMPGRVWGRGGYSFWSYPNSHLLRH